MMELEEIRQVVILLICQDNCKVRSYNNVSPELCNFLCEPAKVGMHFRSATCQVDCLGIWIGPQGVETLHHGSPRHDFFSIWPGIHMAMLAGLIAHLTDVDLEDLDPFWLKWI
jgi:hypothetical protein